MAPRPREAPRRRVAAAIAPAAVEGRKAGAARLSIVSNTVLIVIKLVAGAVTGSIAIITEAVHSSIDLLASIVAYLLCRKADEPADEDHLYGHAKAENLAAAIEGALILVGAGVIVFEAVRRLVTAATRRARRLRHRRDRDLHRGERRRVDLPLPAGAIHESPALEGRRGPPARGRAAPRSRWSSGLVLIQVTGVEELDSIVALMVAVGDRLRRGADPEPLVADADGRGPAGRRAGHRQAD